MDSEIYVNNNDVVETYFIKINESRIKNIRAKIDITYGKGKLKTVTTDSYTFSTLNFGKKVEIVSENYVGVGQMLDSSYPQAFDVKQYEYKYYAFYPSELSCICDEILNAYGKIDLSKSIKRLFEYEPYISDEVVFLEELYGCVKLERIDCEDLIKSDLTEEKKEGIFKRIIRAIKNEKQKSFVIICPRCYEDDVNNKVSSIEKEDGSVSGYDNYKKVKIKKEIFNSLPKKTIVSRRK